MRIMMKALTAYVLSTCLFITHAMGYGYTVDNSKVYKSQEAATAQAMIKKVFDTYRYRMTVEWNQNDPSFQAYAQSEFEKCILELLSKGVAPEMIRNHVEKSILDE